MKKYLILLSLLLGIVLVLIQSPFFTRTASTAGSTPKQPTQEQARLSAQTMVNVVGQGNPLINLGSGRELLTSYRGSTNAEHTLEQNLAQPTALASADFDEDGTADLIAGYAGPSGGILTVHRGNVDAIYPNSSEATQRKANGSFTESPFLAPALVLELPEAPDCVAAGDFDADGHWDLAMAANGSQSLYLLSGDGQGNFSSPKAIDLPGRVSALAAGEINRADGLTDIAVAVVTEHGAQMLVFEGPDGALRSHPEAFSLPAPATTLVLGKLNADYLFDLAAAAGPALLVVEGRDRKLSLDAKLQSQVPQVVIERHNLPFAVRSMSVGNFDAEAAEDLALLADDGSLHLLNRPDQDGGAKKVGPAAGWSTRRLSAVAQPGASQLITARVSSTGGDDLMIADSTSNQLHIVTNEIRQGAAAETLHVDGGAAAVLPMRLSADAMSDLVVLRGSQVAPTVVASTHSPQATFTVTNTNDSGAGSLRNAITLANQNPGLDLIDFNIAPGGQQTITPLSILPIITGPVTIDGTTQPGFGASPIIELNGSGVPNGSNGLHITGGNTTVRGLVINRIGGSGDAIELQTNGGNIVEGNFIGTNLSGNAALPNGNGVFIREGSSNNLIGGTTVAARNLISGNGRRGIHTFELTGVNTTGNVIQGNYIGTDFGGTAALGGQDGMALFRAAGTSIGGTAAGAGNIISGNGGAGILLDTTGGTLVQGNLIGTDRTGTVDLGNSSIGITTPSGSFDTFGGTTPAARNIISGNNNQGILIRGVGNFVQGNFIGTNAQGTAAIGNAFNGVATSDAPNNTIGGATVAARNIISGNGQNGVSIGLDLDNGSTGVTVRNNFIGTDVNGINCLGNVREGVIVSPGQVNHTISDNVISCNGLNGVNIPNAINPAIRIEVSNNRIFANGALGINLGDPGITPNDPLDADGGANLQQNFPELISFTPSAPSDVSPSLQPDSAEAAVTVNGRMNSTPNMAYTVHWYFSDDAQCTMNQQGSRPLVFDRVPNVNTDGSGNADFSFQFDFPAGINSGIINCTATDSQGNTSEYSTCFPVNSTPTPTPMTIQFASAVSSVAENGLSANVTVNRLGNSSGPATVDYATSDLAGVAGCNALNSGNASSRCDYATAIGRLSFAAGETSKTISVLIVDDGYGEGDERFNITLSNAVGASLGAPAATTVTITDNELVNGGNPINEARFFVRQHYLDFFSREPDASGFDFWTNPITACGTDAVCIENKRIDVSTAFYISIEFQQTGYLVHRIYKTSFGDATGMSTFGGPHQLPVPVVRLNEFLPDTQKIGQGVIVGQTGWEELLEANKQAFTTEFVQRSRFPSAFPSTMTPAEFVDALFTNAAVTPLATDRQMAINEFGSEVTSANLMARGRALRRVAENRTVIQQEYNRAFVLMQYFGYLRRNPNDPRDSDYTGYDFWLNKLNQFSQPGEDVNDDRVGQGRANRAEMVKAFILSSEYRQRFGP